MIHIPKAWYITVFFREPFHSTSLFIYDDHFTNVLRKFSEISFAEDIIKVEIIEKPPFCETTNSGVFKSSEFGRP